MIRARPPDCKHKYANAASQSRPPEATAQGPAALHAFLALLADVNKIGTRLRGYWTRPAGFLCERGTQAGSPGGRRAGVPLGEGTYDGRDTGEADAGPGSAILVCPPPPMAVRPVPGDRGRDRGAASGERNAPEDGRQRLNPLGGSVWARRGNPAAVLDPTVWVSSMHVGWRAGGLSFHFMRTRTYEPMAASGRTPGRRPQGIVCPDEIGPLTTEPQR